MRPTAARSASTASRSASPSAARGACGRHRHGLPGAAAVSRADGGREHLPRPGAARRLGRGSTGPRCGRRARSCSMRSTATTSTSTPRSAALSVANRQRVEIAKALSQDARVADHGRADSGARRSRRAAADGDRARGCGLAASASSMSATACRRSSRSPTASRCCATARMIGTRPIGEVTETVARRHDGGPRDRPAVSRRPSARSARPLLELRDCQSRPLVRDISLRAAARRDRGARRSRRFGPHRAGAHHFRHHAGHLRRDPDRRQAGHHRQPRAGARSRHRLRPRGPRPAGPDPAA